MPPEETLRAVLDSVFAGPAYRWVERPDPLRLLREWFGRLSEWLAALREGSPLWYRALIVLVVVVLLAILAHAAGSSGSRSAAPPAPRRRSRGRRAGAGATPRALQDEADRAAREGRYAAALRLGFLALALELDAGGSVSFAPGKTPADYAREARLAPADRGRLGELVRALYRHVYGAVPCSPDDCARWLADARREWHAPAT